MLIGDVSGFANVFLEIEEGKFDLRFGHDSRLPAGPRRNRLHIRMGEVELPWPAANGVKFLSPVKPKRFVRRLRAALSLEQRPDVPPVDWVRRQLAARQLREGGEQVDGHGRF